MPPHNISTIYAADADIHTCIGHSYNYNITCLSLHNLSMVTTATVCESIWNIFMVICDDMQYLLFKHLKHVVYQ